MDFNFLTDDMEESISKLTEVMNDFQLAMYKLSVQAFEIGGETNPLMN